MLSLVPAILILLLASPANSQLAPGASAVAADDGLSVPDHTGIEKEPDKAQPGALESNKPDLVAAEAQALKQTPPAEDEDALRRELAAARAELARQAQALEAQQRTDEALAHSLETAQRVIENLKAATSLWDSEKGATPEAHPSVEVPPASATRALDDERRKVELLEQELARARQTIDALKTSANLAAVEQAKAVKDRQAAEAASKQAGETFELERERAAHDLDIVRKERDALKQNSIALRAELDQERERATGLARSLSAARETIEIAKDQRRAAAVESAPKAHAPERGLANASSRSGVRPARKPGSPEKQKVKVQRSPQRVLLTTIALPEALLPTRPPKGLDPRQ